MEPRDNGKSLALSVTEWVASLLFASMDILKVLCSWHWSPTPRCYQREGFFWAGKKNQCLTAPGGSKQTLSALSGCDSQPHRQHISGNFTWDTGSPSSPQHSLPITSANTGIRVWDSCSEKLEMVGTISSHWALEDAPPKQNELGDHQMPYKSLLQGPGGKGRMRALLGNVDVSPLSVSVLLS